MNFNEMFDSIANAPRKKFEATPLPEGDYIAEVISVVLGETKDKIKGMFKWNLKIIEGERKNSHIFINRSFSKTDDSEQNEKALNRALEDFKILGLPCDRKNLENTMRILVGKHVQVNVKDSSSGNGNQWYNLRCMLEPSPDDATSFGTVVPDENVPF